jgi:hypothetical protein
MISSPTRRDLILTGVLAALAGATSGIPVRLHATSAVTLDQFLALSKRLTVTTDLDPEIGNKLLGGFLAAGHGDDLAKLVAGGSEVDLADAIVAAWYAGVYDTGHGLAVATFDRALLWNAMTFTKPFAECGGETGYWSLPPQG